jgi:hypothetical protein
LKARTASVEGSWSESSATEPLQSDLSIRIKPPGLTRAWQRSRHVEAAVFPLGELVVKRVERGSKTKLDLVGDTCKLPMTLGGFDDRDVDLAGEDPAVEVQASAL